MWWKVHQAWRRCCAISIVNYFSDTQCGERGSNVRRSTSTLIFASAGMGAAHCCTSWPSLPDPFGIRKSLRSQSRPPLRYHGSLFRTHRFPPHFSSPSPSQHLFALWQLSALLSLPPWISDFSGTSPPSHRVACETPTPHLHVSKSELRIYDHYW